MSATVGEQQIAAYVDGALDKTDAARVRQALAEDAGARAYAAEVERANRLLQKAFDAPMHDPVSAELRDAILKSGHRGIAGTVVDFAKARGSRPSLVPMAVAAGIALVVGIAAGTLFPGDDGTDETRLARPGAVPPESPLHAALESLPSGELSSQGVQPVLTFRDAGRRYCREFDIIGQVPEGVESGIACRNSSGRWDVEVIVSGPPSELGPAGYRPASGPGGDVLDVVLDALGAQPALSASEESQLLKNGWK
jgi:hypothetical protein